MAAIWNDISITWKGKPYTMRPTLDFINHLEQRPGNSLTNLIILAGNKNLGTVKSAEILYDTLVYVGADIENVEEAYGVNEALINVATTILAACLPQPKVEEGEEAPKKPAPKRKPSRKPTGAKRTG